MSTKQPSRGGRRRQWRWVLLRLTIAIATGSLVISASSDPSQGIAAAGLVLAATRSSGATEE